jgi:aromatic-L-amino-acid decarboxylase
MSNNIRSIIEPGLCHSSHHGFMAYFPDSSTFEGILGELYSAAYNGPALAEFALRL